MGMGFGIIVVVYEQEWCGYVYGCFLSTPGWDGGLSVHFLLVLHNNLITLSCLVSEQNMLFEPRNHS
jgi:hypothetical protein